MFNARWIFYNQNLNFFKNDWGCPQISYQWMIHECNSVAKSLSINASRSFSGFLVKMSCNMQDTGGGGAK